MIMCIIRYIYCIMIMFDIMQSGRMSVFQAQYSAVVSDFQDVLTVNTSVKAGHVPAYLFWLTGNYVSLQCHMRQNQEMDK